MNLFKNTISRNVIASLAKQSLVALTLAGMLAACGDDSSSSASSEDRQRTGDLYLLSFIMETSQYVGVAPLSANQKSVIEDFIEVRIRVLSPISMVRLCACCG
jgi:hypothetical protein